MKYPIYPIFDSFWGKAGIYCYSILIFGSDLEPSHHFASFRARFDMILTVRVLIFRTILFNHKCGRGRQIFEKKVNFDEFIVIRVKNAYNSFISSTFTAAYLSWLWFLKIRGAESAQYSWQHFRQKTLYEKKRRDAKALTVHVTKEHPKGSGDEFLDWSYVKLFCRPNSSFDFFREDRKLYPFKWAHKVTRSH